MTNVETLPRLEPAAETLNPLERQLLGTLAAPDPVDIARIPSRWPLIRMHVPVLLDRLAAAGLVRLLPGPVAGGAATLTPRGRETLLGQPAGSSRARTPSGLSVRK
jgi:hypothetical protein